jgi:hypothetical protein
MFPPQDRLTLDALLSDPLTRLVMQSDNLTPEDMAQAFDEARSGLAPNSGAPCARGLARDSAERGMRWNGY